MFLRSGRSLVGVLDVELIPVDGADNEHPRFYLVGELAHRFSFSLVVVSDPERLRGFSSCQELRVLWRLVELGSCRGKAPLLYVSYFTTWKERFDKTERERRGEGDTHLV